MRNLIASIGSGASIIDAFLFVVLHKESEEVQAVIGSADASVAVDKALNFCESVFVIDLRIDCRDDGVSFSSISSTQRAFQCVSRGQP
jgi:hypothetical protein